VKENHVTEQPTGACHCTEFQEALAENMTSVAGFRKGQETWVLYLLPHPSGNENEERLMVFCPFCAGTVGDGWLFPADTGN